MKQHWLRRPETIRKLWVLFILVLAATVGAEFAVKRHTLFGIDSIVGFNAWYGFAACTAMIILSKLLGYVLKRRDTYYDG